MPSCAIKWCGKCTTTSSYTKDGITFHRFPSDAEKKEAWIEATHRELFFPNKHSVVCSRHFTPDCFEYFKKSRRLYSSSVPTLYLPLLTPSDDSTKAQAEYCSLQDIENKPPTNTASGGQNYKDVDDQYLDLTPRKRKMKRQIDHLIFSLNKKKKDVKRLQDKTRTLKKKVASLEEILDTLTKNSLLNKENEDTQERLNRFG